MARRASKTQTRRRASSGEDGENIQNQPAAGEIGDPALQSEFPETPPDSGKLSAIEATKRIFSSSGQRVEPGERKITQHVDRPLGHPNRVILEDASQDWAVANRPFGSEAQNLDPETGNIIPMSPEERRTGEPDENE
jgi:hypothetical protein